VISMDFSLLSGFVVDLIISVATTFPYFSRRIWLRSIVRISRQRRLPCLIFEADYMLSVSISVFHYLGIPVPSWAYVGYVKAMTAYLVVYFGLDD